MKYKLATIIVCYNSQVDIESCVRSAIKFSRDNDCVVVVDNASTDNSRTILESLSNELEKLLVVFLDNNIGFGSANNVGFRHVGADYYLLLNADAWLVRDSAYDAIHQIESDNAIVVCGIPLVFPDGLPQTFAYPFSSWRKWLLQFFGVRRFASVLIKITFLRKVFLRLPLTANFVNSIEREALDFADSSIEMNGMVQDVDWVCGAAMLLRGSFIRSSGGFDENIFLYGEDEDLCINAHQNGKRVVSCNVYPIVHVFGWGNNKFNPIVARLKYMSLSYFLEKNITNHLDRTLSKLLLPLHVYGVKHMLYRFIEQREMSSLSDAINIVDNDTNLETFSSMILEEKGVSILGFVNAHAINLSIKDEDFLNALLEFDILLRDGVGIEIMYKMLGKNYGLNMNGTDYIPKLITASISKKYDIILYGTVSPYNELAADSIRSQNGVVTVVEDGFKEDEFYIESALKNIKSNTLIILAMGMPKQEKVASKTKLALKNCEHRVMIVCGGAVLDFIGGKVKRAPIWFQNAKLEWLYRLYREPQRMFKRYVIGNLVFLYRVVLLNIFKVSA